MMHMRWAAVSGIPSEQKTGGLGYHDFCKAGAGEADLPTYRGHRDRAWDGNSSDWKRRI